MRPAVKGPPGGPSGFPSSNGMSFLCSELFCVLWRKTPNKLRYKQWAPHVSCKFLKFHLGKTADWHFLSPSCSPYLWGMWAEWRGQPHNEEAFLVSIGTLCPFKKKYFEGFLHLRACEHCCAERELAWAKPRGIRLTLPVGHRTGSEVNVGSMCLKLTT